MSRSFCSESENKAGVEAMFDSTLCGNNNIYAQMEKYSKGTFVPGVNNAPTS